LTPKLGPVDYLDSEPFRRNRRSGLHAKIGQLIVERVFLAGVVGFDPDLAQAREWYDRAIKLGSTEASRQLERLASMPK
jgi:TPR repeat protein